MADGDFRIQVSAELKSNSLQTLQKQINNLDRTITLKINDNEIRKSLKELEQQIKTLSKTTINISSPSVGGATKQSAKQVDEVTAAYKRLMQTAKEISSINLKIGKLDSKNNAREIEALSQQLKNVHKEYQQLIRSFGTKLSASQISNLNREFEQANNKLIQLDAKLADTQAKMNKGVSAKSQANAIQAEVNEITKAYNDLMRMAKQISSLRLQIAGLDPKNAHQLTELSAQLQRVQADYNNLFNTLKIGDSEFNGFGSKLSTDQLDNLNREFENTSNQITILSSKYADVKDKLSEDIKIKIDTKEVESEMSSMGGHFKNLKAPTDEVKDSVNTVKDAYKTLNQVMESGTVNQVSEAYKNYRNALATANNQIKINTESERQLAQAQKQADAAQKLQLSKTNLSLQMDTWLQRNSAAAKEFGGQIRSLQAELQHCDATRLSGIKSEFQAIVKQAILAGKNTQTFADRLKTQFSRFSAYISIATVFAKVSQGLRSAYEQVLKVDSAMTELRRVTDLTETQYASMYDKMAQSAQKYGAELDKIIHSTASWVKLGFDENQAVRLSEITSMYQHVTDLDEDTAVKNLVTAYKGFEKQLLEMNNGDATKAMEQVADIYDLLGNKFAESAADVGEGLRHSASVLAQGGASIQEAAGMFTGIQEVLQNSSTAGNTLKILTLRIRGMKGELESLGEEVDNNITSISKIQTQILNLTHGKVNIFDESNNFRDIYEIMQDIAEIYNDLSDPERASLLELIAGKNRAVGVEAMLQNWQNVEKATKAAYDAAGTAQAEQDKWANSIQGHLNQLTTAWQALSQNLINSDFLKGVLDVVTTLTKSVNFLFDKFGTLPTLLTGVVTALSVKNIGLFTAINSDLDGITNKMGLFGKSFAAIKSDFASGQGLFRSIFSKAISSDDLGRLRQYSDCLKQEMSPAVAYVTAGIGNCSTAAKRMATEIGNGALSFEAVEESVSKSNMALGTFKAALLNIGITVGISLLIKFFTDAAKRAEEYRKAVYDAGESAKESSDNLFDLMTKYQEEKDAIQDNIDVSESFIEAQDNILSALGITKDGISDLIKEYGSLDEAIKQVAKSSIEFGLKDLVSAAQVAGEYATQQHGGRKLGVVFANANPLESEINDYEIFEYLKTLKDFQLTEGSFGENRGSEGYTIYLPLPNLKVDKGDVNALIENLDYVKTLQDYILQGFGNDAATSEMYQVLNQYREEVEDEITSYVEKANAVNEDIVRSKLLDLQESDIPEDLDITGYKQLVDKIVESVKSDNRYFEETMQSANVEGVSNIESLVRSALGNDSRFQAIEQELTKIETEDADTLARAQQIADTKSRIIKTILSVSASPEKLNAVMNLSDEEVLIAATLLDNAERTGQQYKNLYQLYADIHKVADDTKRERDKIAQIDFYSSVFGEDYKDITSYNDLIGRDSLKSYTESFDKQVEALKEMYSLSAEELQDRKTEFVEILNDSDGFLSKYASSQGITLSNLIESFFKTKGFSMNKQKMQETLQGMGEELQSWFYDFDGSSIFTAMDTNNQGWVTDYVNKLVDSAHVAVKTAKKISIGELFENTDFKTDTSTYESQIGVLKEAYKSLIDGSEKLLPEAKAEMNKKLLQTFGTEISNLGLSDIFSEAFEGSSDDIKGALDALFNQVGTDFNTNMEKWKNSLQTEADQKTFDALFSNIVSGGLSAETIDSTAEGLQKLSDYMSLAKDTDFANTISNSADEIDKLNEALVKETKEGLTLSKQELESLIKQYPELGKAIASYGDDADAVAKGIQKTIDDVTNSTVNAFDDAISKLSDTSEVDAVNSWKQLWLDARDEVKDSFDVGSLNLSWDELFSGDFHDGVEEIRGYVRELKTFYDQLKDGEISEHEFNEWVTSHNNFAGSLLGTYENFEESISTLFTKLRTDGSNLFRDAMFQLADTNDIHTYLAPYWDEFKSTFEDSLGTMSFSELIKDSDFQTVVSDYTNNINTLKNAFDDFANGVSNEDIYNTLFEAFKEDADALELLGDKSNFTKGKIQDLVASMDERAIKEFGKNFENLATDEDKAKLQQYIATILELSDVFHDTKFTIDIASETTGFNSMISAIKESASATGLSIESISALKNRYQDLQGVDLSGLFERTTHGVILNTQAVNELEKAYQAQTKSQINKQLKSLKDDYDSLTEQINNYSQATSKASLVDLYKQRNGILEQINDVNTLSAEFDGLTSAYYRWEQAQSGTEVGDMYDNFTKGLAGVKELYDKDLVGTEKFKSAVQLMSYEDLSDLSAYEIAEVYEQQIAKIQTYFTEGEEGAQNFVKKLAEINEDFVKQNDNGTWSINADTDTIAQSLGISVEAVEMLFDKLKAYGYEINFDSLLTGIDDVKGKAEEAVAVLQESGKLDYKFDFDTTELASAQAQIAEVDTMLSEMQNEDGTIKTGYTEEDVANVRAIKTELLLLKQSLENPPILQIDTSEADADVASTIELLQNFKNQYNEFELESSAELDTTKAEADLEQLKQDIINLDPDIKATLNLNSITSESTLEQVNQAVTEISKTAIIDFGVDSSKVDAYAEESKDETATVTYDKDSSVPDNYKPKDKTATVVFDKDTHIIDQYIPDRKVAYIDYKVGVTASSKAQGTAFAQGNWGTKEGGTALMGELGQEIIVRNGRFFTVGNQSAEFVHYQPNDIIFNAEQSRQLLTQGKITNGAKRGVAYAQGNAFVTGKAFANVTGQGGFYSQMKKASSGSNSNTNLNIRTNIPEVQSQVEDLEEAIEDVQETTEDFNGILEGIEKTVNNTYITWEQRNEALAKEIAMVTEQLKSQTEGIDDLSNKLGGLYEQQFDNIDKEYDNLLSALEHEEAMLNEQINRSEKLGGTVDQELKDAMVENQYQQIDLLTEKYEMLTQALEDAVSSGAIEEYSEAWWRLTQTLYNTAEAIESIKTGVVEWEGGAGNFPSTVTIDTSYARSAMSGGGGGGDSNPFIQLLNGAAKKFDYILNALKHEESMLEEYINQAETKGYLVGISFYEALQDNEERQIAQLERRKETYITILKEGLRYGEIKKGDQAWAELTEQINATTVAIEQGNTALERYAQEIRNIKNEVFDLTQERISAVAQEADFVISLLSNSKLQNQDGSLSGSGEATVGLHAMNYNVYMSQADDYAQEIQKINKDLAKDPSNNELIERRQQLLELQRESILAAENEKKAITDLVSNGMQSELNTLKELIDNYKNALDSEKDLYDYQKKIKEQTSEISTIQKQLQAYRGDNSEESKATVQKLKVQLEKAQDSLEETQYDKYISDTKQLLDSLYLSYETIFNARLDNVDGLLEDMIDMVNHNSGNIASTIYDAVDAVGYTFTDEMQGIWGKYYQNEQTSRQQRIQDTTSIIERLIANGKISEENGKNILTQLGNGDITSTTNAVNEVWRMYQDGTISAMTATEIFTRMTSNDSALVRNGLDTVNTLIKNGTLTETEGKAIVTALVTNDGNAERNASSIVSRLLLNHTIQSKDAATIITAMSGGDIHATKTALEKVQKLADEGKLTATEAGTIVKALGTGDTVVTNKANEICNKLASTDVASQSDAQAIGKAIKTLQENQKGGASKAEIKDVVSLYSHNYSSTLTATKVQINSIRVKVADLYTQLQDDAKALRGYVNTIVQTIKDKYKVSATSGGGSGSGTSGSGKSNDLIKGYAASNYMIGGTAMDTDQKARNDAFISQFNAAGNLVFSSNAEAKEVGEAYNQYVFGSAEEQEEVKKKYGLKVGARKVSQNELVWTQENGQEFIIRPSDGAILTPLATGDSVLTAQASRNLWDMSNNPDGFIKEALGINDVVTPQITSVNNNNTVDNLNISFTLPNVKNYEEMVYAMQHDKSFERLVRAMTVDKMFGRSSLKKYQI